MKENDAPPLRPGPSRNCAMPWTLASLAMLICLVSALYFLPAWAVLVGYVALLALAYLVEALTRPCAHRAARKDDENRRS